MAEGRMLKRAVSDSRRLSELKTDSARLLWTWILPYLDIEGRYLADPNLIKGKIVPRLKTFNPENVVEYLADMNKVGLIILYESDGEKYLQYRNFHEFQKLRKDREGKSKIPAPPLIQNTPAILQESSRSYPEKFDKQDMPYILSELLLNEILKNNPKSRLHNLDDTGRKGKIRKWAQDIDLLLRIDKQGPSTVEEVIKFATSDSFWKANILSGKKLREKWDTLVVQCEEKKKKQGKNIEPKKEEPYKPAYFQDRGGQWYRIEKDKTHTPISEEEMEEIRKSKEHKGEVEGIIKDIAEKMKMEKEDK